MLGRAMGSKADQTRARVKAELVSVGEPVSRRRLAFRLGIDPCTVRNHCNTLIEMGEIKTFKQPVEVMEGLVSKQTMYVVEVE